MEWLDENEAILKGVYFKPPILSLGRAELLDLNDIKKKVESLLASEQETEIVKRSMAFIFSNKEDFILFNKKLLDIGVMVSSIYKE